MKRSRIVVADPPWEYNDRRQYRLDNPEGKTKFGIGASGNYAMGTSPDEDLFRLGGLINEVTTRDAYLFMWATCPRIGSALQCIKRWGFEYKTIYQAWLKCTLDGVGDVSNPGHYHHSNLELLLIARRKHRKCWNPTDGFRPHQIVRHPKIYENKKPVHSRKPEVFQDQIDQWLGGHIGDHSRLELYARRQRPGWICLGGDLSGRDISADLLDLAQEIAIKEGEE